MVLCCYRLYQVDDRARFPTCGHSSPCHLSVIYFHFSFSLPCFSFPYLNVCYQERYRILEQIGDGAFGVVVKAAAADGELVAIKRIKKPFPTWDDCLHLREVQSLSKLKHSNIVK